MFKKIVNVGCSAVLLSAVTLYGYHIYLSKEIFWWPGLLIIVAVLFNWYRLRKIK